MIGRLLKFNLISYLFIINCSSFIQATERCLVLAPYCDCKQFMSTTTNSSISSSKSLAKNSFKIDSSLIQTTESSQSNKQASTASIFLNCKEITNSSLFVFNLFKDLPFNETYNLMINNTKHEIVENVLNNLVYYSEEMNSMHNESEFDSSLVTTSIDLRVIDLKFTQNLRTNSLRSNMNGLILVNLSDIREHTFDFDLTQFTGLNYLNITFNEVDYLNCSRFNKNLKIVDLSKNQLKSIFGCSLVGDFINLISLDLSRNNLTFFELTKYNELRKPLEINLNWNEWNCNADLMPLIQLVDTASNQSSSSNNSTMNSSGSNLIFIDHDQLKCSTPKDLYNLIFKKVIEIQNTEICSKCRCYAERSTILRLDCENRGLTKLPIELPPNTKIVNLNGNQIKNLNLKGINKKQREIWENVIRLTIQNNMISSLDGLDILKAVRELNLTHNLIKSIPMEKLAKLSKMDHVALGFNPFICDCGTIKYQQWLRGISADSLDLDQIHCDNSENSPAIYTLEYHDLCKDTTSTYYWNMANVFLSVIIVVLIIKLMYDYIWKLKTGKLPYFFKLNC